MDEQIKDYIDINLLQKLQDSFSNLTGMSAVTYTKDGYVTRPSNPSEFASLYSKDSVLGGEENISESKEAASARTVIYTTKSGLTEMSVLLTVKGQDVGAIVAGQVCDDSLTDSKITRICSDSGYDYDEFTKAIKNVPVKSKTELNAAAEFLTNIGQLITSQASSRKNAVSTLDKTFEGDKESVQGQLHQKLVEIDELIESNAVNNKKLYESYDQLTVIAQNSLKKLGDTKETVKSIQDIAMNTRILGFNASIEASRAKESGKGFGVIAQEVRSLADVSNSSTDKIRNYIQELDEGSEQISVSIQKTEGIIRANIDNADSITSLLSEINTLAGQLK